MILPPNPVEKSMGAWWDWSLSYKREPVSRSVGSGAQLEGGEDCHNIK